MTRYRDFPEDLNLPARAPQILTSRDPGIGRWPAGLAGMAGVPLPASTAAPDDPALGPSMSAGGSPAAGWLSFRRIIDIPLQTCVAALENGQRTGPRSDLRIGRSLLRGPIEHDRDSGTYRIEVRLARGPLRPLLPMRLHIDRWSGPAARTALELIPSTRVRPAAAYFRAGHLLLDALTRRLVPCTGLNDLQREDRPAAAVPLSTPDANLGPVFAHGISLREPAGPADIGFEEVE
jgi:hypothetical protein